MTTVEIIAIIFIVISIIKLVVIYISPKTWYSPKTNPLVRLFWNRISTTGFSLLFGGLILFYLLTEISITQIFVSFILVFVLAILTVAPDIKKVFESVTNYLENENIFLKYFLPLMIWILLTAWVLLDIFYY